MKEMFGVIFSAVGAALYYLLAAFILSRRDRGVPHYIFALLSISLGTSELMAFLEFTGTPERAHFLIHIDLTFLALGAYFYLLFIDYFREDFKINFAVISLIPISIIISGVWLFMVEGVKMGPYGWVGVYSSIWNTIYGVTTIIYILAGVFMGYKLYRTVDEPILEKKIKLIFAGGLVSVIGALINVPTIMTFGRVFPIMETATMITAVLFAMSFLVGSESE